MSGRAPRVLVLGALLGQPMGGVRRHNAELLPRAAALLAERGGSLAILEGRVPAAFPLPDAIEVLRSGVAPRPPLLRWRLEGIAARRALASAREAGRGFDLVHTGHVPAPSRLGVPFTITIHDLRHLEPGSEGRRRRLAARAVVASAVRRAARTIAVSETVRAAIVERFSTDPARVRLVPNAADHFEPLPREAGPDAPILYVGHLEKRKNLEVLVRALAADPGLPPLVLAGAAKDGEDERLAALARDLGVLGRIRFAGAFDDAELPRLLARAACAVLPSRIEGFGIPALEAQRARVPLAISKIPALVEVAGAETPAFPPADSAACAHAIREAMRMPEEALARAASRAARYSWQASALDLVATWSEATG